MLRVWGGGYYESDSFYDLCDEYGIMVWHDFMFACTMYPYDDSFIQNVRAEAIEQVTRLRNHPCMALWCGNNEVSEGWNRWGWKNELSPSEMRVLDKGYQKIFLELLPSIVADNSNTPYHHSSPLFGRGDSRSFSEGDMHDWGIWHDEIPMEDWGVRVPRFMSEFGVQSYPSEKVLRMMSAENFSESDSSFLRHQGHPRGFRLMHDYAERWYRGCSSLDSRKYGYITQAVQAEGMVNAINVHRIRQPYCMGTMFWQLNDIWPSFSWSAIDFASNEKLLFQMLQEAYAPQTVIALLEHDSVKVFWVSDRVCDRDSAKLFLRWNAPGESLDVFPDVRDFKGDPGISCHVNMGVSLLYAESVAAIFRNEVRDLSDWTLDCSIRIAGQEDFSVVRKFRLLPGSKGWIVPDIIENSVGGKDAGVRYRRQVFRRL
jgi:beta-mannosidase